MVRAGLLVLALVLLAPLARAGEDAAPKDSKEDESPTRKLSSWLLADDEEPPEPPIVRANAGIVLWPFLRTSVTIGKKNDQKGREIQNSEDATGLPGRWFSPAAEVSVGTTIRGGLYWLDLDRQGDFRRANETIDVGGGRILANKNDYVSMGMHYTQVDGFAHWDFLYSKRLRLALLGGVRVIRIATRIAGIHTDLLDYQSIAVNDWLVSPILGGQLELSPMEFFTVYTSIRFIDWAWRQIGLREQRTYEVRLGCAVQLYEDMLAATLDFRFLSMLVNPSDLNGGKNLARYELEAGGIALGIQFKY